MYDPKRVQHYSHTQQTWYSTDSLAVQKSYKTSRSKDAVPKYDKPSSGSLEEQLAHLIGHLELIAQANIVRGGVYGLIGNSYLVIKADSIKASIDKKTKAKKDTSELVGKGEALALACADWLQGVYARRTDVDMESGDPPKGKVWVDPEDHEMEI